MTGITRVSKESIFSDLNHLEVVTTTSDKYAAAFGFTEEEVFAALDEFGLAEERDGVKHWYDGFLFGRYSDIYNPWSIINYLEKKKLDCYWANSSSNSLVNKLLREGHREIKEDFAVLLRGENIVSIVDEHMVYDQLSSNPSAIWSLLLASGYLKVLGRKKENENEPDSGLENIYTLAITNLETKLMFEGLVVQKMQNFV